MEESLSPSSILLGSLSVHIGSFLMLRAYLFWEFQTGFRIFLGIADFSTAIVATFIGRVQSSIESQITYSSIAQIGLISIEITVGLENVTLIYSARNALV